MPTGAVWQQRLSVTLAETKQHPHRTRAHSPPQIVLSTQLHVGAQDGDLGVDDDGEQADEQHKAKQVVKVPQPQGGHGEVELDEQGAEGQHTGCGRFNNRWMR